MTLTTKDIILVKETFTMVTPVADTAAQMFYDKLFELDPTLRSMFPDDLTLQKHKLMQTFAFVIEHLNEIDTIVSDIIELADRHVQYGVQPAHYDLVGHALIATLEEALKDTFTTDVQKAWIEVYTLLSRTMIEHAYPDAQR